MLTYIFLDEGILDGIEYNEYEPSFNYRISISFNNERKQFLLFKDIDVIFILGLIMIHFSCNTLIRRDFWVDVSRHNNEQEYKVEKYMLVKVN